MPEAAAPAASGSVAADAGGPEDSELVRRRWPEVLGTLERKRVTWAMVSQSAQVARLEAGVLTLAFDAPALASRFSTGPHAENVALAVREALGLKVRVEASAGPVPAAAPGPAASASAPARVDEKHAAPQAPPAEDYEDISDDDASDDTSTAGVEVVTRLLGGRVVED